MTLSKNAPTNKSYAHTVVLKKTIGTKSGDFAQRGAIKKSNGVTTTERLNGSNKSISPSTDNYICDECAQMATHGEEITPKNASKYGQFPNPMSFDSTPGFTQVESFEGVAFNKGIASIGGQHTVSYYGTSNNGTVYVLSKDGRSFKPQVYPAAQSL